MSHATLPHQPSQLQSIAMKSFPVFCLFIVLFVQLFGNATIAAASVTFLARSSIPKASFTMGQFLNQASSYKPVTGMHVASAGSSAVQNNGMSSNSAAQAAATAVLPPSAEPPTMKTVSASIPATYLSISTGLSPQARPIETESAPALQLSGSDPNGVRMEVAIPAGALDFSSATVMPGVAPQGNLTIILTQTRGHFITATRDLATYQIQVKDAKGRIVQGVKVRTPVTYTFHYQKSELSNLLIDPNKLALSFPSSSATNARMTVVPLTNHTANSTLTASVASLAIASATVSGGTEPIQAPPKPRFASVQGNSGQITYSYPFTVAPGPQGVTPQLQLGYSSGTTNARHDPTTPAGNSGDGWTLSLGSISAEQYPDGTIWYSISGIGGVSDRLIPNKNGNGDYATEHMSYLKVSRINNPVVSGRYCFAVWDGSGNKYELGCTKDSLQSYHDSDNDQFDYAFDLDKVTASNEGSGTNNRTMTVSYLQDSESENGHTSVRDAAPQQIVYRTTTNGNTTPAGTVDFFYSGPSNSTTNGTQFETQYTTAYESACHLPANSGQQRCDDPLDRNGLSDPSVMSTLELTNLKSYVGDDSSTSHLDYSYALTYLDTSFLNCPSSASNLSNYWCAGDHVLTAITPTVYQNGSGHQLAGMTFAYSDHTNKYDDFTQSPHYHMENMWAYLISYHDHSNGVGASSIVYQTAWNNSHGTPYASGDNRTDALYCDWHPSDCTSGSFNPADDQMWTEQVVFSLTSAGKDSSNSNLSPSTINYNYWLAQTQGSCPSDSQGVHMCVGFGWMPNSGDTSSEGSYYHGEFRGFGTVLTTVPNGDNTSQPYNLVVQKYAATYGWGSALTDSRNYLAGSLLEEDVYQGPYTNGPNLIQQTVNSYAGQNSTPNACSSVYTTTRTPTYTPCEVVLLSSKTTQYEQTGNSNANAPWVQKTYTYDDYNTTNGLDQSNPPKYYHNKLTEVTSGSNVPTSTQKWTYATTNTTISGSTYYNVHSIAHTELDDSNGNIWQCSDTRYDEGVASGVPTPDQGLPTTVTTYSSGCSSNSAIQNHTGYNTDGNAVATVDGVATSSATATGFYSSGSAGCNTVTPRFLSSAWTAGRYTSCTAYNSANAQSTDIWNAFNQHTQTVYDATQGLQPTAITDANNLTATTIYNYDSAGNPIVQIKASDETGGYTKQSILKSSCTDSSVYPCLELDANSSLYSGAVTQVFYDSMGRKVETLTPGPTATQTTIGFTVYNDVNHSVFQSQQLVIAAHSTWLDPNDPLVANLGGTATYVDAAGRTIATIDALFSSGSNAGITCPSLSAYTAQWRTPLTHATTCSSYGIATSGVSTDSNYYATTTGIDANNHVSTIYMDALKRTRYTVVDSGIYGGTLSAVRRTTTAYNALDKPTSVTVTDLVPQSGQTTTSVTTTTAYDSLGQLITLNDPDRGVHVYTYDADGHSIGDTTGSGLTLRSVGSKYDLSGRVGCVQNSVPISTDMDIHGACSSGATPYVQNTYDGDPTGVPWSTNYPVGKLTQSVTTTTYPAPDNATGTVTQNFQYDQRGRTITNLLKIAVTGGSIAFPTFPTYQETLAYNDADQPTTTQTSNGGQAGYTFSQAYDGATGMLIGLSNTTTASTSLAGLSYNANGLISDILPKDSAGTTLADENWQYDGDLRPASATTTWSSSGNTIFSDAVSYDLVGNVISRATTHAAIAGVMGSGGSEVQNFCYNEQSQLVWASNSIAATPTSGQTCGTAALQSKLGGSYTNSYIYTHLGQLWQAPLNGSGTQEQYLYCNTSQPHQLTALSPTGGSPTCSAPGTTNYSATYNTYGDMVSRGYSATSGAPVYDATDRMVRWSGTTATSSEGEWYLYDANGNRVMRRSTSTVSGGNPASSPTTITVYAFGLEEHTYNYSGSGSGATTTNNTYYYSLGGHLLGMLSGSSTLSTSFTFTDLLSSVVASISNTAGNAMLLGNQVYGPYGNLRYSAGTIGTAKGYTGQYGDDLTGLDYYNARYYDPVTGRFTLADTVQDNLHGWDPYSYVSGNPETKNDPTGHANDFWLQYLVGWYDGLHGRDDVQYSTRVGNAGTYTNRGGVISYPDIINNTQGLIWDAKTGSMVTKFFPGIGQVGFGTDWPDPDHLASDYQKLANLSANGNLPYSLGTRGADRAFGSNPALACLGTLNGCTAYFIDGVKMQVRVQDFLVKKNLQIVSISGIIEYKITQPPLIPDGNNPLPISQEEYQSDYPLPPVAQATPIAQLPSPPVPVPVPQPQPAPCFFFCLFG